MWILKKVEDMEERSEEIEESSNSCSTSTCSSSASVRGKKRCTEMRSEKPAYLRQKGTILYVACKYQIDQEFVRK